MDNVDVEAGGEDEFQGRRGRKYRPVIGDDDRAVLEMSSMDPPSSSRQTSLKNIKVSSEENLGSNIKEGSFASHEQANSPNKESKLELFGFDSLVNILGLKDEQGVVPSSPRDGENIAITQGRPKINAIKSGTLMGVFVPCLQNILGIIYYIRFSWIVGMAGIGESMVLVALYGTCTFLIGISLSVIATNSATKGGGPYYLIGRALGPEVGVSIGLCFFLGNVVAGSLYILGEVQSKNDELKSKFDDVLAQLNLLVSHLGPMNSNATGNGQIPNGQSDGDGGNKS